MHGLAMPLRTAVKSSFSAPLLSVPHKALAAEDYRTLADFRRYLRRFLAFSEEITSAAGMHPSQYQALLAIRTLADDGPVTTSALAHQLGLRLNSVVELVDRLVVAEFVSHSRDPLDRRTTMLGLTPAGAGALEPLAAAHLAHHSAHLSELIESMTYLVD